MKNVLACIVCCLIACAEVIAEEPARDLRSKDSPPFTVTAQCQIVLLPQSAALALLPELADDAKCEAAYARLQTMIHGGDAQLVADLVVKTCDGNTASTTAAEEMRYPTEFNPPDAPDPKQLPKENAVEILKNLPVMGFSPTSFETRDVGPSLELTPISLSADGRSVEVNVTARDVRFLHWARYDAGGLPNGERLGIEQPQFHSIKNTSTLRLQNGQRILFGAHKIPGDKGSMEVFLLRISAAKSP